MAKKPRPKPNSPTFFESAEKARKCSHGVSLLRACVHCEETRRRTGKA